MNNDGSVKASSFRSKKSVLLIIDVVAIVLSFALALAIRFRILVASLGSNFLVTTYMPFFIAVLIAYVVIMLAKSQIRIDRLSKREIVEQAVIQQIILSAIYIAIFFLMHRADAISRIAVGLFFIFCAVFCGIGRIFYHEYCQKKSIEVVNNAKTYSSDASGMGDDPGFDISP